MSQQYTVKPGDTLYVIAEQFYGDGNQWQKIAQANNIQDPSQLQAGTMITIP